MLSLHTVGQLPISQLNASGEPKHAQTATDQLNLQTNIKGETEQQSARAVSPVVEISLTENQIRRNRGGAPEKTEKNPALQSSIEKSEVGEEEKKTGNNQELTEEEEKQVRELKKRDAEVKAHEQAHAAVGGSYASAPSYEYTTGPDNKQYAVAGEVQIDSAAVPNNPEATIRKMDIVIRAALAPQEPSAQDKQVASQAQQTKAQAQAELANQRAAEQNGESDEDQSLLALNKQEDSQSPSEEIIQAITAYETANQLFGAGV